LRHWVDVGTTESVARQFSPSFDVPYWLVTGYEVAREVLSDTESFSTTQAHASDVDIVSSEPCPGKALTTDGEGLEHLRPAVRQNVPILWQLGLGARCRLMLDRYLTVTAPDEVLDFASEVAWRLPLEAFWLLVPVPAEDRPWVSAFVKSLLCGGPEPAGQPASISLQAEAVNYFDQTALFQSGRPLRRLELASAVEEAMEAANLTQAAVVMELCELLRPSSQAARVAACTAVVEAIRHPDILEYLRRNPGSVRSAVAEILRWSSPIMRVIRTVRRERRLYSVTVRPGERVVVDIAAANMDPYVFAEPHTLNLTRWPNPHLAFGPEPPNSLGATMARVELAAVLTHLAATPYRIEFAAPPTWDTSDAHAGYSHVSLRIRRLF
jgi:cytochrome P450